MNTNNNRRIFTLIERISIFISIVAGVTGVVTFWWILDERKEERIFKAWEVVREGRGSQSGVVRLALERLYKEDFSLAGINVTKTNLSKIQLNNANLKNSYFEGANLKDANLRNSYFEVADLRDTNLSGANLSDANLSRANIIGANLSNTISGLTQNKRN